MPILGQPDSSIYNRTKPLSTLSGPGQLAPMGRAGRVAGPNAAMERFGAEQQENAQIAQLAQQYGDDYDGLIGAVEKKNPKLAFEMGSKLSQFRQEKAAEDVQNTKSSIAHMNLGVSMLQQAINNPALYPTVAKMIAAQSPQLTPLLPQPDDPQLNDKLLGLVDKAQSTKDYLEHREKSALLYLDGKHDVAAATLLAGSANPQQRQVTDSLLKAGGLSQFSQMFPDQASAQTYLAKQQELKPVAEKAGSDYHQYAERWAKEHGTTFEAMTTKQEQQARKEYGQADDRPRVSVSVAGAGGKSDVQEAVAGMKDGTIPPQLPGRASKDYSAVMAEAHRQGFDLTKAVEDWTATQKYLGTLNGNQQTRLRQAVKQVEESVPLVRSLVTQWDSAGIPALSSANLKAAMAGTYGNNAQSLARRLNAQIADMTSELGTVYKGGNSSTDESLKLAAQNLGADWSKKAALDALDQIEKNLQYRRNSMKLGPVTSGENRYAPNLSGTPPGVSSLLGSQKPGKYTLSDGSKWIKAQDGTISQAP